MRTERDRVISVCLTEAEWQAFVARHPDPVRWLQERILAELQPMALGELSLPSMGVKPIAQA
jgi:hypothetical protein